MDKKIRQEDPAAADDYRQRYVDGIAAYVRQMNEECKNERRRFMPPEELVKNPEFYREKFKEMLGLNRFAKNASKPVEMTFVGSDELCRIYRLSVYITDEIPFYSMLLIPHNVKETMPLVIAQHGGGGTPELCCDMNGQNNYNHMAQRAMARGTAILAPQLLLWSLTEIATIRAHNVPYDRNKADIDMKRFGSSITALEISGIMKTLDYVCGMKEIDDDKIGMIGLSYGGYFTLHTMAADTRIKAGYCAGAFNDRDVYNWADWSYKGSALAFQDAEVAALCAPRKLYVQVGKEDQVFDYTSAIREAERIRDYFNAFGAADNFKLDLWDGGHTISEHDEGYEFLFSELNQ
ncbi:MAG: hypothetical protein IJZ34_01655 [Lachnospiraceae bacterium]|nr:hypothetical protein [Lachnospiraceae bacterium]